MIENDWFLFLLTFAFGLNLLKQTKETKYFLESILQNAFINT